jgi:AbrB family transcriptional regulator (stage V sporulation protein T)
MFSERVTLAPDGRIVIPIAARRENHWKAGQCLVVESDGTSLLIRSYDDVLRETQAYFSQFATPGVSQVDALFAERREEFAREEANWPLPGA